MPPVLVSELASEEASGRLLCQVSGPAVQPSFGLFTTDTGILTGKVSGSAADFCPVSVVTKTLSRSCHNRDMKITGAVMLNFTVFSRKISVKFIITAPVNFVIRMSRSCHNRVTKLEYTRRAGAPVWFMS